MEIQIAVAKINKYAVSESGDTLEVVERPGGGLSVVLVFYAQLLVDRV